LIGINIANHRDLLSKRYIHDTARIAEALGFDSVWIPDHAVAPRAVEARYGPVYDDAIAVLGYLAAMAMRRVVPNGNRPVSDLPATDS
jgi:alkanesulfonate monooxygenase SsuD/methylene tetrahydromethanopterin reductase-like flavin-dependent oxidoreductase (luciferase family)